ncbi:hypothetical protein Hanom_Chr01g00044341 [Helianthus anomalus]
MAIKLKPQGPRYKKFEFWTKVAKVTKPQGPKWQFTQIFFMITSKMYLLWAINLGFGYTGPGFRPNTFPRGQPIE